MDNDKWLCTIEVFEREGGGLGVQLQGPGDNAKMKWEADFIVAAESVKRRLGETLAKEELEEMFKPAHTTPTDPKTT